jgi:phospholipase/carboxylesterase
MRMRAWYDLRGLDRHSAEDEDGFRASSSAVGALIRRENERGIPTGRIVVAGFSQGGAMSLYLGARYPEKLAGIVALSCYLPLADKFQAERLAANQSTPIFIAHGSFDEVIAERAGVEARAALEALGYAVEWHSYPMGHAVCAEEIAAISAFLRRMLAT